MSSFIPMVYAVLKDRGVDTKGMSAEEAVKKYNELTGKSGVYDTERGEEKGTAEKINGKQPITDNLISYTKKEKDNMANSKKIILATSDKEIRDFITKAHNKDKSVQGKKLLLGKINNSTAVKIKEAVGVDLSGYNLEMRAYDISHSFNQHGDEERESSRGQRAISESDLAKFSKVITSFDTVTNGDGLNSLTFMKRIDGRVYAITYYATGNKSLSLKTMYINKK